MLVLNAFSANMLAEFPSLVTFEAVSLDKARSLVEGGIESAVGHESTAAVFSEVLGVVIPAHRVTVTLAAGATALVGQYVGPRLPEGAMHLPEGASIKWLLISVT